ncbi:hypothetical protein N7462_006126 [Penicillium macrosclerotiorum]|uniref:uncharacterized protein n=1 Tax=Penicillium macrosclerotiorum TaxID=303699 RepID=UPI0025493A3A|nr:uncharacterized protein N7462_006126 [Penicillium macrosclerotiorum]KAJ5682961.1 hypothetical protein N7462_006126 [Penicillium macrosclerotiorum]
MAALVQTIPQQSGTVPVLQTRPSSSSGTFASPSTQASGSRFQTMSWSSFNAGNSGSYRTGHPVVAPYAYAPNAQHRQSWSPHLRPEHRTFSAPSIPQGPMNPTYSGNNLRVVHPAAGSVSNSSSSTSSFRSHVSKDDSAIPSRQLRAEQPLRPLSTANLPPSNIMNISSPSGSAKPSPNRYRRANQQRTEGSHSQSPAAAPLGEDQPVPAAVPRPILRHNGHSRVSSVDDSSHLERPQPELAKRYRRRSLGTMDPSAYPSLELQLPGSSSTQSGPYDFIAFDSNQRPRSSHSHRDSSVSVHSAHSSTSSVSPSLTADPGSLYNFARSEFKLISPDIYFSQVRDGASPDSNTAATMTGKPDEKRTSKPSPLSQPASSPETATVGLETDNQAAMASSSPNDSPAARRLTELKNESSKRSGKSRLRRAFSFGSASEILKASPQSNASKREAAAAEKARRDALREELGEEQAAIAELQEASGLGESIYSHQGNFFSGSTDALSVSSTASSASMMLRKMGRGMKRGSRSLVGLFRPKSIASINSVEGATPEQPMAAPKISVVNVEGERADAESVTVNPDAHDMPRGATVFPKAENGSEPRRSASIREHNHARLRNVSETSESRKSIVGGDQERAEVLAAVRKGILKKTHSDLGVSSAHPMNGSDSPHSSAPTTPDESSRAARPNDHVKIAGEDYFLSEGGRYSSSEAKSAPITPQPVGRNIVFSPRIQFHETWPSGEYDRRGEIATCNRLTPLLAQQIREEINNFKMEMEVHENSKIYTHFI